MEYAVFIPTQNWKKTMTKLSRFWEWHAKRYAKQKVGDDVSYQAKLKRTQEHLKPSMTVLEFGCGTGTTALIHAPFVSHIRAIDGSSNMVKIANEKAEMAGIANATFEQAAFEDLDIANNTYDVVMGHSVLHLLENKEAVISNVFRILKPGGLFITSTTCLGSGNFVLKGVLAFAQFFGLLPLVKFFTIDDLVKCLTATGYMIDYQWQPGKGKAVFIIASKPD